MKAEVEREVNLFEYSGEDVVFLEEVLGGVVHDAEHAVAKIRHGTLGQLPDVLVVIVEQPHLS
jgi:hypothetical protein